MQKPNRSLEQFGKTARRTGLALTAFGGAAIAAGIGFVKAANEQIRAERTLGTVIDATGTSWASVREEILATTAALQAKTNTGDEAQLRILSRLVPVLGSYEKALAALPLVLDAAATSGLQASSIAGTLGRALSGTTNTAESLGITFDETASFSERLAQGLALVGGAAAANADPFEQLGNSVGDVGEAIGASLIPVIEPLALITKGLADDFGAWAKENPEVIRTVFLTATAVGALGVGLLAIGVLVPAVTTGIGLIKAAIAALTTTTWAGVAATTAWLVRIAIIPTLLIGAASALKVFNALFDEGRGLTEAGTKAYEDAENKLLSFGDIVAAETVGAFADYLDKINFIDDALLSLDSTFDRVAEKARVAGKEVAAALGSGGAAGGVAELEESISPLLEALDGVIPQIRSAVNAVFDMAEPADRAAFVIAGLRKMERATEAWWLQLVKALSTVDKTNMAIERTRELMDELARPVNAAGDIFLGPSTAGRNFGGGGRGGGFPIAVLDDQGNLIGRRDSQTGTMLPVGDFAAALHAALSGLSMNVNVMLDSQQIDSRQGQMVESGG